MKAFLNVLNLKFLPFSPDFGLLILRAGIGGCMLFGHGWKKVEMMFGLGAWAKDEAARKKAVETFHDPHLGQFSLGPEWSLRCATFAEVVCSALLIIGFCTRFAAAGLIIVMAMAFFVIHQGVFKAGEMSLVYLAGFTALLVSGPGKYSFDGNGGGGS